MFKQRNAKIKGEEKGKKVTILMKEDYNLSKTVLNKDQKYAVEVALAEFLILGGYAV